MKHNSLSLIIVLVLLFSCSESKEATLENFNLDKDVFVSGASLMNFSFGLHDLEEIRQYQDTLLIGVHGSNSRGYEWIYPLQTLNENKNLVSFFRWDDDGCPDPSIDTLLKLIKDKTKNNPNLNKVILLGHSYGGLLVTALSQTWDMDIPLQIHSIAGPLKGMNFLSSICDYKPPVTLGTNTSLHQWRTIQELDGAFRDLKYDPQVVEIKNSLVTRLPQTYKGNKLGHNWSISWVADEINQTH
jgi:hypothetical protein|tara:strand:+ start:2482 stop:3210 length:729 start_codon:yes stop_codon:yes gene_type:complete